LSRFEGGRLIRTGERRVGEVADAELPRRIGPPTPRTLPPGVQGQTVIATGGDRLDAGQHGDRRGRDQRLSPTPSCPDALPPHAQTHARGRSRARGWWR